MSRNISVVLELWGGWAATGNTGVDYSPIAAGFKGLLPYISKTRLCCSDDDALVVEGCLARLRKIRPYEHHLLVAHYLYGVSKRKIARLNKKDEKVIQVEMLMAEGFVDGCLSMLDIELGMDV